MVWQFYFYYDGSVVPAVRDVNEINTIADLANHSTLGVSRRDGASLGASQELTFNISLVDQHFSLEYGQNEANPRKESKVNLELLYS